MKIALVTHSFSRHSGVGRVVIELARHYAGEGGHEIHIVLPQGEAAEGDYRFHRIPLVKLSWETRNLSFFFRSGSFLRRERFDAVHLHTPCWYTKGVMTCHGLPRIGMALIKTLDKSYQKEVPLLYILRNQLSHPLFDYNYRPGRYRKIIALSREIRDFLISYYRVPEEAIALLHNGIDLVEFSPDRADEARLLTRSQHGIDAEDFVFLFVGNYFKRKGLAFAMEALATWQQPGVRLLVVGRDRVDQVRFEEYARELGIEQAVVFVGDSLDTKRYYGAADAFLFPSFYDAYPLVNLEAMASGLPVITSRRTGTVDIIEHGTNGLIVEDPTDIEQLSQAMLRLVEDPALRASMSSEARKTMLEYSWDRVAAQTLAIYRGLYGA